MSPQTKLLYVPANNNICAFLPKSDVRTPDANGLYGIWNSIFGRFASAWLPPITLASSSLVLEYGQASCSTTSNGLWRAPRNGWDVVFAGGPPGVQRSMRALGINCGASLPAGVIGVPPPSRSTASSTSTSPQAGTSCTRRPERLDSIQQTTTVVPQAWTVLFSSSDKDRYRPTALDHAPARKPSPRLQSARTQ